MLIARNRKTDGYATISMDDGTVVEMDTLKCAHCQSIILVGYKINGEDVEWATCFNCKGFVCGKCFGKECQPFLKQIEQAEEKHGRRYSGY